MRGCDVNRNAIRAWIYRQFDTDPHAEEPATGFGGWQEIELPMSWKHCAIVSMHALAIETREYRNFVEYLNRAEQIMREKFPPLLTAARKAGVPVIHIGTGNEKHRKSPQYAKTLACDPHLIRTPEIPDRAPHPEIRAAWNELRADLSCPGKHNRSDSGFFTADFGIGAEALPEDYIAFDGDELDAVCRKLDVCHLIYIGFALNFCLDLSPGGMTDMWRRHYVCSAIREATTSVENKESCKTHAHHEQALWRVALRYGFVFHLQDILESLEREYRKE